MQSPRAEGLGLVGPAGPGVGVLTGSHVRRCGWSRPSRGSAVLFTDGTT